jgi:hypothetical protein
MILGDKDIQDLGPPYWGDWLISAILGCLAVAWLVSFANKFSATVSGGPIVFFGEHTKWSDDPGMFVLAAGFSLFWAVLALLLILWSSVVIQRYLYYRDR